MSPASQGSRRNDSPGRVETTGRDCGEYSAEDFRDFYFKEYPKILRWLRHISIAIAEDAAQEAFITAFDRWSEISKLEYPAAYVAKIASNLAVRYWSRASRETPTFELVELMGELAAWDDEAEHVVQMDSVRRALCSMPQTQAKTFDLIMDGCTAEEAGIILRVGPATVRSKLRHARNRLKTVLLEDKQATSLA